MPEKVPLLAKPTGILWTDHRDNLIRECQDFFKLFPLINDKYRTLNDINSSLEEILKQACIWHDIGKICSEWQSACWKDYEAFLKNGKCDGANLRNVPFRHEMDSLVEFKRINEGNFCLPILVAIAAHHGRLSYQFESRWSDKGVFKELWNQFERESTKYRLNNREHFFKSIIDRFALDGTRSLLRFFDHRASAGEEKKSPETLHQFLYNFPYSEKRGVQKIIESLWNEPIALLRAPTGAGKTDASLLWAKHQIEEKRASRVVIAMPTRFTANSLAISVTESLSQTGLYHSTAFYQGLAEGKTSDQILNELYIFRDLHSPCTVTTIDHVCSCLCGVSEKQHASYFSLANSCLIIDEADFYDDFTQENIRVLLEVLYILKVPVLIMSATLPNIAMQMYSVNGLNITNIYEAPEEGFKISRSIKCIGKVEKPNDISELLKEVTKFPTIIYANTVDRAQGYYHWLISNGYDSKKIVLYHSRFTEPHKAEKEKILLDMLGFNAWEKYKAYGIAILTQIGELSVNISSDVMISDLCPIDRLAQRLGRLTRFNRILNRNEKGRMFLVEPVKTDKDGNIVIYPAPYGHYDLRERKWVISDPLLKTKEIILDGDYTSTDLTRLVNDVYDDYKKVSDSAKLNAIELKNNLVNNWMILPHTETDEDENVQNWRSRDIPPQKTVFADINQSDICTLNFSLPTTRKEYELLKLKHGISIPVYLFEQLKRKELIAPFEINVRDNDDNINITIWIANSNAYSLDKGLHINTEESDE